MDAAGARILFFFSNTDNENMGGSVVRNQFERNHHFFLQLIVRLSDVSSEMQQQVVVLYNILSQEYQIFKG